MAQSNGNNYRLNYEPSTNRITTALGGGLQPCGYITGNIGNYQIDLKFMNMRYGWRSFTPNAGFDGSINGNRHSFREAQMLNEGVICPQGTNGKIIGGVILDGVEYQLSTQGSIYTGTRTDMNMVLAHNTRGKITERNKPLLDDYLHIAIVSMLFDGGKASQAEDIIFKWLHR